MSRKHADLLIDASGTMEILDLESSSGTYLVRHDKEEEVSSARLEPGDLLRFGKVELTLEELRRRVEGLALSALPAKKTGPTPLPALHKKPQTVVVSTPTMVLGIPGIMVRCECGAVKEKGRPCPSCGK